MKDMHEDLPERPAPKKAPKAHKSKLWSRIFSTFMLLVIMLLPVVVVLLTAKARGHTTVSGTPFPADCCSDKDCEAVTAGQIQVLGNGDWLVQLSRGVILVPRDFARRDFPEPQLFVCASKAPLGSLKLLCVLTSPAT